MRIMVVTLGRKHSWSLFGCEIAESLSKIQKDVFFIGSREADNTPDIKNKYLISTGKSKWSNLFNTLNLLNYIKVINHIRKVNPDYIIYSSRHLWLLLITPLLKALKIKQYMIIHDATKHLGEESTVDEWIDKRIVKNMDGILTLSKYVENMVKKHIDSKKRTIVLFHPFFYKFDKIKASDGVQYENYALIFGRVKKYKGIENIIELWEKHSLTKKLIILGSGDDINCKNENIIRINKEVSDEELKSYLLKADYIIAPYIEASQSGVIATSLGVGTPVIASNVGGIPEQFDNNTQGLFFDLNESDECILLMLEQMEKNKEFFQNNITNWRKEYNFINFSRRLLDELRN